MHKIKIIKAGDRAAFTSAKLSTNPQTRELSVNTRRPEPKSAFQTATEFLFGGKTAGQISAKLRNDNLDGLARFVGGH